MEKKFDTEEVLKTLRSNPNEAKKLFEGLNKYTDEELLEAFHEKELTLTGASVPFWGN